MKFSFVHANINVTDLQKSIQFYQEALFLKEVRRKKHPQGKFEIVFLADDSGVFNVELTWLSEKQGKYELGDNESHLAFRTDDYEAALALHKKMSCVCFENEAMGIYFIEDPDGYWIEIIPTR